MNMTGKKVTHNKFGAGKVIDLDGNKIQIAFGKETRTFIYPDSFEKFFSIQDEKVEQFVNADIEKVNLDRAAKKKQQAKDGEMRDYIRKQKGKSNSQAVFGMHENDMNEVSDKGVIFTGHYASGVNKGTPRIPKNINMNSACLLTQIPKGGTEADRLILGVYMASDDFVGTDCKDGLIPVHTKYQITLDHEDEEMLFWDYFAKDERLTKWGHSEMKYLPGQVIQNVLETVMKQTSDDKRDTAVAFYQYFCDRNKL